MQNNSTLTLRLRNAYFDFWNNSIKNKHIHTILFTSLQANLNYLAVHFIFFLHNGECLEIIATAFCTGQISFMAPNQQCQSTKGKSKKQATLITLGMQCPKKIWHQMVINLLTTSINSSCSTLGNMSGHFWQDYLHMLRSNYWVTHFHWQR